MNKQYYKLVDKKVRFLSQRNVYIEVNGGEMNILKEILTTSERFISTEITKEAFNKGIEIKVAAEIPLVSKYIL